MFLYNSDASKNNSLLIVDDDKSNLLILIDILQSDYTIYTAKDGEEAVKKAKKYLPDLILLDIILPGIDGYEAFARLRELNDTEKIPVIFITGLTESGSEEKGLALGAVDYIIKPFNPVIVKLKVTHQIKIINLQRALANAAEKAEAASLSKTAFLANMSHEIRTPMNAILGITEIQMENESLPPETREALGKIYSSGDLLLSIINDILDMSKIEADKLELVHTKYDVASLINDTVQLNMMRFENKPIELKLEVDETIPSALVGDELRIRQILNNLLSNAAKYTASGEVVFSVACKTNDKGGMMLVFRVQDTGQGMTEEQVNKLFDAYSRFNMDVNRTIEGTGLGMNITSKLLHMMNGEISVESEPGKGSEFTVVIPQGSTDSAPLGNEIAENLRQFRSSFLTKKKTQLLREPMPYGSVLVVDDMEANLYVAKGLLTPYGLRIDTAISGFEAIKKNKNGTEYDIVFMDHMMPKMDGIETTGILRKTVGYTRPIIALTADAVAGRSDVFLASGFDDFISKPINTRRLNDMLNTFIRDKQTPQVIASAREQYKTQQKVAPEMPNGIKTAAVPDNFLLEELSRIEDLDVKAGLMYLGQNQENYFNILRLFSEKCDSYIEELDKTLKAETWKDYTIKVHALKGVFANLGMKKLSQYAAILEKASRTDSDFSPDVCRKETPPFIADIHKFMDRLRRTSLMEIPSKKKGSPRGNTQFLKEQITLLKESCLRYSFGDTKKIITALGEYKWDAETEKELENIRQFIESLDYDKALERVAHLL
jgi:signal transduction histidine kinase/HPt (histidine-containing phosphotransfer) domain-containing protein